MENHFQKITGIIEDASQPILAACGALAIRHGPEAQRMGEVLGLREGENHLSSPSHEPPKTPRSLRKASKPFWKPHLTSLAGFPGVFQNRAFSGMAKLEATFRKDLERSAWDSFWKGLVHAEEPKLDPRQR